MIDSKTSLSLVLGSGGARGLAHIGVIRCLEERGFDIRSVAGCSMGALVGGVFAAGKLDELEQWLRPINKAAMIGLLDVAWGRGGLVKGDKIINTLKELVGAQLIEELPMPFTAVATDIQAGKELWLNSGCLFDAIRASISIPLIFAPFVLNNITLIDGGVLNPVPIAPTFGDQNDLTIAVNLDGAVDESLRRVAPDSGDQDSVPADFIGRFIDKFSRDEGEITADIGAYDIASQAVDAMQGTIARQKLAAYPPDLLIEIPRNACGVLEFDRGAEMIDLGYSKAEQALAQLMV